MVVVAVEAHRIWFVRGRCFRRKRRVESPLSKQDGMRCYLIRLLSLCTKVFPLPPTPSRPPPQPGALDFLSLSPPMLPHLTEEKVIVVVVLVVTVPPSPRVRSSERLEPLEHLQRIAFHQDR